MKLNEVIELNGKEYTVELNRESLVRIEQYTNIEKTSKKFKESSLKDKSEIELSDDENPFADTIDEEKLEKEAKEKEELIKKSVSRAFWIWLYPVEKLSISEVNEILEPYFEDEEKGEYIAEKYQYFYIKSSEIRQEYLNEAKNLKAQAK